MKKYEMDVFWSKEDNCWVAVAPQLRGCSAFGSTPELALKELEAAMELWLDTAKHKKWSVPEPLETKELKGRILLRVPSTLHRELIRLADSEGVSLNQFMLYVLARYRDLGHRAARFAH